jgi:AcrR family transcriptional regulator
VARPYASPVRAESAARTRRAVLDAAARLFVAQGYVRTTVADIAAGAGVAVNTVYTSVGGKPQLVLALTEEATGDELIEATLADAAGAPDPRTALQRLARGTGQVARRHLGILTLLVDNRTTDPAVDAAWQLAAGVYRSRQDQIADRLHADGALRADVSRTRAREVVWFYMSVSTWRTARDLGWEWDTIADWLADQLAAALLAEPAPPG